MLLFQLSQHKAELTLVPRLNVSSLVTALTDVYQVYKNWIIGLCKSRSDVSLAWLNVYCILISAWLKIVFLKLDSNTVRCTLRAVGARSIRPKIPV